MPMLNRHILSFIFCLFGLFLIIYSAYSLGDFSEYGAAFMPSLIGGGMIVFSLLDIFAKKQQMDTPLVTWHEIKFVLLIIGIILFYVFFAEYLGFIVTGFIVIAPLMMKYAKVKPIFSFIISAGIVLGIYYLFTAVLLVPLPQLF
ncbi:TPA: tripartite tricarboxylate transporter TctB family protein [Proteus mirabilis]